MLIGWVPLVVQGLGFLLDAAAEASGVRRSDRGRRAGTYHASGAGGHRPALMRSG